jgi:hypothetical protein
MTSIQSYRLPKPSCIETSDQALVMFNLKPQLFKLIAWSSQKNSNENSGEEIN